MLLHKSVEFDSRVRREARALSRAGHEVTVVHLAPEQLRRDGYEIRSALPASWVRRLPFASYRLVFTAKFVATIARGRPDAVHANDAAMLVPGFIGARLTGARLIYDSHELATGVAHRKRAWAVAVSAIERALVRRCDAVITVSDGIADRLQELYRLRHRPTVVRNLTDLQSSPGEGGLRKALRIGDAPLVLHQGAPARSRGCETLVRAMAEVPGAQLVFLGDGEPEYVATLTRLSRDLGLDDRVHFQPSVPLHELLAHTREADVGVSLLEGSCENHRLALPNKVFEYVAAGVPVVASELPELRRLVAQHAIGWTVDPRNPADVAAGLRDALGKAGNGGLRETLRTASEHLSWESEQQRLITAYARLEPSA
jgi:glycosyltransferase involved in cell wall biosynthesis